jgi:nitrogen fixation NifU-like protein
VADEQLLRELLLEHYRAPHHAGEPAHYDRTAQEKNRSCGDEVTAYVSLNDGKVTEISHVTRGCALSIASASLLSDELVGMTPAEVLQIDEKVYSELLGFELSPNRMKCGLLALWAVQSALKPQD